MVPVGVMDVMVQRLGATEVIELCAGTGGKLLAAGFEFFVVFQVFPLNFCHGRFLKV